MEIYAHTREDEPEHTWEPLLEHLEKVGTLARQFAEAFESGDWGHLAGLWHDVGKYRPEFQARLRGSREHAEHAGMGAALAASRGNLGMAVAFAIAGHHTGLANRDAQGTSAVLSLRERLDKNIPELERLHTTIPTELMDLPLPPPPAFLTPGARANRSGQEVFARRCEFWTRFLFSVLIDADRLATEAFYEPTKRDVARDFDSISELRERLNEYLGKFNADTPVNRVRAEVLEACRKAANLRPGLFSLTVPTGGGKTLSSMAFALEHAALHGLRRVIIAIPYTSIIEQNARVYRQALGDRNIIEHHSNIDESARLKENRESEVRRQLAAENWDAPVIVTTNVQLFESLFSDHPSRCRKLHNIARSVIVLDEAQSLPAEYLNCVLDGLRELTDTYGCSVVLMTATQPALNRREALPFGLDNVHEISPDPDRLARDLDRVKIHWIDPDPPPLSYADVAAQVAEHYQVLAIVHLRKDARELAQLIPEKHRYHLSALMCPAHRSKVLADVIERLKEGLACRLVATQLIEAGVDIDFPVVYRALAGIDSLAQAAGRCNREGVLTDATGASRKGDFFVFRAETAPPPGFLRAGLESTLAMLQRHGSQLSFARSAAMEEYFRILYSKCETDRKGVQAERAQFNFANVAAKVRLIEDGYSHPIVVPWGESAERVAAFAARPDRETQRALQPYLVQIPERELNKLVAIGAVEYLRDAVHVLTVGFEHLYHHTWGFVVDEDALREPGALFG